MRNYLRLGFMAVNLILCFGAIAVINEVKAQNPGAQVYQLMETNRNSLKSLKTDIKMTKANSQTGDTDESKGTLLYLPATGQNMLVRIDWSTPQQEILAIVKGQYVAYRVKLNQAYVGKVDRKNANVKTNGALDFISMSKDDLKKNYEPPKYLGTENLDGIPTFHIKLIPKLKKDYQYAEVWVDGNGMPLQGQIVEKNNDSTTIKLGSNYQKNAAIKPTEFKVDLPRDCKIIKQ